MCGLVYVGDPSIEEEKIIKAYKRLEHRGPDDQQFLKNKNGYFAFTRLSIMDLTPSGDQPFQNDNLTTLCNGEIYNFRQLKEKYEYTYVSESDCEVLLPIFRKEREKIVDIIDGEYAFVIYNQDDNSIFAARDPMGIRPLFYGYTVNKKICFASEAKALMHICHDIKPFPPGYYFDKGEFVCFKDLSKVEKYSNDDFDTVVQNINKYLTEGIIKRLDSDAPLGFLLSGGLDSSLVCAVAQKHLKKPIKTFSIGMSGDAIDLKYAKEVADYIKSDHQEIIITQEEALKSLEDVIYHLETYDITTIRASVGMFLICKAIREKTEVRALLTGEVSDEIFGYKYTDFAPSPEEFQKEAAKRVKELYMYDVLRADRCIAAHSLEARVPFSDTAFVEYVMVIDPKMKMNSYGHGKYLLRKAFEDDCLPNSILYREKAAFSDAVGHSLVDGIKAYAEEKYTEQDVKDAAKKYNFKAPFTKESLLYREIFEKFYPGYASWVVDYWMPNKEWENCDVSDPSARVLPNYGKSGE